ncbi:hypothetical protein ACWCOZ_31970 [Streptomyces sp. NPDC001840]
MTEIPATPPLLRFIDNKNPSDLTLIVDTPGGTYMRRIPQAMELPQDVEPGHGAEEAAHTAAATWGMPDFVFRSTLTDKGSGRRELGDCLLLAGDRAAVVQVKSRTIKPKADPEERDWIRKVAAKAVRQAKGTVRTLRLQDANMVNGRGRTLPVRAEAYEWMAVFLLDHNEVPADTVPTWEPIGIPTLALTRRDWDFLFDQLHSTTAVLDYLFRAASEEPIALGEEPVRYYEFAAADAEAPPGEIDTELVGPGGVLYSTPLLPQTPAGAGETRAHLVIRFIAEDLATSMLRDSVTEANRFTVLSDFDRLPVGVREEWGQLLLDMLDDVEEVPEDHLKWRVRRQLDSDATHQLLFACATRSGPDVEAGFGSYVMLRHHEVAERTGRPDALSTLGVMLTPTADRRRPWHTTMVRTHGPSSLTPEEFQEFEEFWSRPTEG